MNDNNELITAEWLETQATAYLSYGPEVWFESREGVSWMHVSDGGDTQVLVVRTRGDMRDLIRIFQLQPIPEKQNGN